MGLPDLSEIRARLPDATPPHGHGTSGWAATALILHPADVPEILFIRRADKHGDPWSGHVALPGGRHEPWDPDLLATARRETAEEVGVALGEPIGRIEEVRSRSRGAGVETYVFELSRRPELTLQEREVARAMWVGLDHLLDEINRTRHPVPGLGPFPGVRLGDDVLWGLTLRTLDNFLAAVDLARP